MIFNTVSLITSSHLGVERQNDGDVVINCFKRSKCSFFHCHDVYIGDSVKFLLQSIPAKEQASDNSEAGMDWRRNFRMNR